MVNRGVPSNACATCKIRRIRCDGARPTCLQCAKSKRFCLGYAGRGARVKGTITRSTSSLHRGPFNPLELVSGSHPPLRSPCSDPSVYLTPEMETFLDIFTVPPTNTTGQLSNLHSLDVTLSQQGPGKVVLLVLDAISKGYHSLRSPGSVMSTGERRAQFEKYRHAMQELRTSIRSWLGAAALQAPIYLFALYEVDTSPSS
jgi:hypothetical protein